MKIRPLLKDKRGLGIGDLYPVILTIALVAILLGIVLYILTAFSDQMQNGSEAQNATDDVITAFSDFVPWIGIILLIVAAAIVLGIVISSLAGGKRGRV